MDEHYLDQQVADHYHKKEQTPVASEWDRLEKMLTPKKHSGFLYKNRIWLSAAVLIMSIGGLFLKYGNKPLESNPSAAKQEVQEKTQSPDQQPAATPEVSGNEEKIQQSNSPETEQHQPLRNERNIYTDGWIEKNNQSNSSETKTNDNISNTDDTRSNDKITDASAKDQVITPDPLPQTDIKNELENSKTPEPAIVPPTPEKVYKKDSILTPPHKPTKNIHGKYFIVASFDNNNNIVNTQTSMSLGDGFRFGFGYQGVKPGKSGFRATFTYQYRNSDALQDSRQQINWFVSPTITTYTLLTHSSHWINGSLEWVSKPFFKNVYFSGGAQTSYLLTTSSTYDTKTQSAFESTGETFINATGYYHGYNRLMFSLTGGIEYRYKSFGLNVQLYQGLSPMVKHSVYNNLNTYFASTGALQLKYYIK